MNLKLRKFWLTGEWSPLLGRLDGWCAADARTWTDGASTVHLVDGSYSGPRFGFVDERADARPLTCTSPSGLVMTVDVASAAAETPVMPVSPVVMNHVAWYTESLEQDLAWLTTWLHRQPVLARERAWEPVAKEYVADGHVFDPAGYYITVRRGRQTRWDHCGWMMQTPGMVDDVGATLTTLGWPIVWGPGRIDGSYLVHFRGPDGHVHDFFSTEPELRQG